MSIGAGLLPGFGSYTRELRLMQREFNRMALLRPANIFTFLEIGITSQENPLMIIVQVLEINSARLFVYVEPMQNLSHQILEPPARWQAEPYLV